jgi:hypothetical protein
MLKPSRQWKQLRRIKEMILEELNISVTGVLVIMLILALAFLFAVREAATWFFKVDDVKRDIQNLREVTSQLEGEIRALHNIIGQAKQQAALNLVTPAADLPLPSPSTSRAPLHSTSSKITSSQFPIVH